MIRVQENDFLNKTQYNNEEGFNIKVDKFTGILTIPHYPKDKFRYCIFDNRSANIKLIDINEFLENIVINSKSKGVAVQVSKYCKVKKSWEIIFKKKGVLRVDKVEGTNVVYDWFIDDKDLGSVLFNNTNELVNITIIDFEYDNYMMKAIRKDKKGKKGGINYVT
jgi:hypothetical protein